MSVDTLLDRLGAEARSANEGTKCTEEEEELIELRPGEASLALLQKIYRSPKQPMSRRLRAAIEALSYEQPKLSAVAFASIDPNSFATRLDRAIERANGAKLIEGRVLNED